MNQNFIKQIIPNLYIGTNISNENFYNYNIKNIISINNINNEEENAEFNIININIKDNNLLIKSNNIINIDFNKTNNFIENSYVNNQTILINSNDIILSAMISIAFIIKKLNITLFDAIFYVYKLIGVDLNNIPSLYIHTLFEYYSECFENH